MRHCLIVVLLWIGGMKFSAYEAEAISGFVANSPLVSWTYSFASKQTVSTFLGITEIAIALLIAARPLAAKAALLGGVLAIGMFATTLSFLVTTPGVWEASAGGFPALTVVPGQFLIKDFVLLAASIGVVAETHRELSST